MSLQSLELSVESDMEMTRKLESICQGLALPAEQGEVIRFLANTENAQKINKLVEDICEALMDYQVCMVTAHFLPCLTFVLDLIATGYLQ